MKVFIRYDVTKLPDNYAEFPYRDFELIEFIKTIKKNNDIIAMYIEEESHRINFVVPSCSDKAKENEGS